MKIKFIINPTGKYNLAYSQGEEVDLPQAQAATLINDGAAVPVEVVKEVIEAPEKPAAETAENTAKSEAETTSAAPKKGKK